MRKHIAKGNARRAARIGMMLIQRSRVFTTMVLHLTSKGYFYELSELALWRYLTRYTEMVRGMKSNITVKRFYLDKGMERTGVPNGKLRPIGAPNLNSKMLFKALEVILRELLEP